MNRTDAAPAIAAVATFCGVRAGEMLGASSGAPSLAAGAVLALTAGVLRGGTARLVVVVVALVSLGVGVSQRAHDGLENHALEVCAGLSGSTLAGTVASDPTSRRWDASFRMRVASARCGPNPDWFRVERTVVVNATGDDASRARVVEVGDRVEVAGQIFALSGWERRFRWSHAVAAVSAAAITDVTAPSGAMFATANAIRGVIRRGSSHLGPVAAALTDGFLLGDTRSLPTAVVDDFRDAGLSHVLVASGSNVAFVLALGAPLLRRAPLVARGVGAVVLIAGFALLTRFEPSVLRASVMAVLASAAFLLGRRASTLRLLSLAVVVLLLVDPFLAHSLAFGLSVCASAGIALLASPLADRLRGPRWIRDPLSVTIAAQIGVMPLLLASLGELPLITPVANLLAVPVAEPITVVGLPLVFAAGVLSGAAPPVASLLVAPLGWMVGWVRIVASACGAVPLMLDMAACAGATSIAAFAAVLRRVTRG